MSVLNNELAIKQRDVSGNGPARRARKEGLIPAVMYSGGKESRLLYVDAGAWGVIASHDYGLLKLTEGRKKTTVLVKEVQKNFLKNQVLHIDFQEVKMDEKIHTTVPVHALPGDPAGLSQGGILDQPLHELEVLCLPGDLPQSIDVDITGLGLDEYLRAGDLELPMGVEAITDSDQVVFHVLKRVVETETEEAEDKEQQEPARVEGKAEEQE